MIDITPLHEAHVGELVKLHAESSPEYSRYFAPFPFTVTAINVLLQEAQRDQYYVILVDTQVAGMYLLRGFDGGFARPAYGVWIGQRFSGQGIARQTLQHAVSVCQSLGCKELMLKVHPDNTRAKHLYEQFGFEIESFDSGNGNLVYNLHLFPDNDSRTRGQVS